MKPGTLFSSIFTRLLLTFLIVITPLYAMTLLMNRMGAEQNKREIANSLSSKVRAYTDGLELEVQRIVELEQDYIVDEDLLELSMAAAEMSDYERNRAVLNLQKRLKVMRASSPYIADVRLFVPVMNRTISALHYDTTIDMAQFQTFRQPANAKTLLLQDGRLYVSLSYGSLPSDGPTRTMFVIVAEMSSVRIGEAMDRAFDTDGGQAGASLLIDGESGTVVLGGEATTAAASEWSAASRLIADVRWWNQDGAARTETEWGEGRLTVADYSPYLGKAIVAVLPESRVVGPLKLYERWFLLFSLIAAVVILLFSMRIYRLIHRPLVKLGFAFRRVEDGSLNFTIQHRKRDEFGYLYASFNDMVGRLDNLIQDVYKAKIRFQQSELKRLQSQINPHFLFNNHFILSRLIKSQNYETAERFSRYIGEYLQFITRDAAEEMTLEREVAHALVYIELQTFSFASRVAVDVGPLPESARQLLVPRLILQPIIENAYKYTFERKIAGGRLGIRFEAEEEGLVRILIEDSGDSLDDVAIEELNRRLTVSPDDAAESTGLVNIHQRIRIRLGPPSGLRFGRSSLGGLLVELTLKQTKGEEPS
ncbi:sensor histidine kinase [Cohnella hashimotonis]|uniref:Histidine kinase n=1 Tax=Cohnella hashimotonis TaxID=2826895 RepID=A0ABT6TKE3_9BACL|nr:histidine kinase [Cohnella hashimotonis]MDI4647041.1 histidine kinase [Cohnella hashimotonis]